MVTNFPCPVCPHKGDGECWSQRSKTAHVCASIAAGETKYLGLVTGEAITRIEPGPSLMQRAANFGSAAIQHVAAGMPESTPEQQAERLAICETSGPNGTACELMTPERTCRHKSCGCQLDRKAAWLDQHCPIGKW